MSLRDILEQQRKAKEQANGQVSGSQVIQPKTEQATAKPGEASQSTEQKPSILDKFKRSVNTSEHGSVATEQTRSNEPAPVQEIIQQPTTKPTVVEQSRPLTLLKRRKLEAQKGKENASSQSPASTGQNNSAPTAPQSNTKSQELPSKIEASASQHADAQKTNDGAANIEELKRNLAYLANNIENKDLVKDIVKTIAVQIKNNPELFPHMTRGDNNLMVRGLRMAYQVAAMKKQEKNEKKKRDDKGVSELAAMAKEIGLDFSGLKLG